MEVETMKNILLKNVTVDELKKEIHLPINFSFRILPEGDHIIIYGVEHIDEFMKYVSCLYVVESNIYKTGIYPVKFVTHDTHINRNSRFMGFKDISSFSKWKLSV